uniref:Uncharacterized protein n=1 Tax=Meloidogyne enterolobii TaxID=390850 RepID=A0A6V7UF75_MELEN|nr:unnamed protein product [Meloidogyne enterolobii]
MPKSPNTNECPICLEELENGEKTQKIIPCNICPLCRGEIESLEMIEMNKKELTVI